MKRLPLIASFILFIALCASAAYWAMQLFKPLVRPVAAPPQAAQPAPKLEAAASLLGGHANAVVASNFQLKGVVVASNPAESVALLAANGKPAQAVRTNKEVMPGVTIQEINRHYVLLSEGGIIKRVELKEDTKSRMQVDTSVNAAVPNSPPSYPNPAAMQRKGSPNSSAPSGKHNIPIQP